MVLSQVEPVMPLFRYNVYIIHMERRRQRETESGREREREKERQKGKKEEMSTQIERRI
jgi:hypothetical protein